jgi:hypothetical protein
MKYRALLPVVLACATALAGCGPSPTQSLVFKAPDGWTSTPSLFGFQVWLKDPKGGSKESIFLVKVTEKPGTDKKLAMTSSLSDLNYKGAKVKTAAEITICGNQKANYLESSGTNKAGDQSDIEIITTSYGSDRYVAVYARPTSVSADPQAEAAIHSLCQKT